MNSQVRISDHTIWFKHVDEPQLRDRLNDLRDEESINLEVGGVVGRWTRMRSARNGNRTPGIRPEGRMKEVWNDWFRTRKDDVVEMREIILADDYLASGAVLFSEWNSPEDEEAFRDL